MGREEMEKKIRIEKQIRRSEIAMKFVMVVAVMIVIWVVLSWAEVVKHNDDYYLKGISYEYSDLNYFKIMDSILGGE